MVAEAYPRLWREGPSPPDVTEHEFDAFVIAGTLRRTDRDGLLTTWLAPELSPAAKKLASIEGWIIGADPALAESAMVGQVKGRSPRRPSGMPVATSRAMPEISRFFGIVIGMYYQEHGLPHFHARAAALMVSVEIDSQIVRGEFPGPALRHVLDWSDLHRPELLENWERARRGLPLVSIPPLE